MKPAWEVTHDRWPEDETVGIASRREVMDDAAVVMFRLADDDGVIYYHGVWRTDGSDDAEVALEELYRWGGYYAGTTSLSLYHPETWEWRQEIC